MTDDSIYLVHIRDAIRDVIEYAADGKPAFLKDRKTQAAIIRNLEVIGEAVKNLSDDLRRKHPDVPWRKVAGMRDILIHEYFGVDLDIVWEVATKEIHVLRDAVDTILASLAERGS